MEVTMNMSITRQDVYGRVPVFKTVGFYPGHHNAIPMHEYWAESMLDKSPLPVAHLLERAFRQHKMVVIKECDESTNELINAQVEKLKMDASISIYMKSKNGGVQWVGSYSFDCYVKNVYGKLKEFDARYDVVYLDVVKDSVDLGLAE